MAYSGKQKYIPSNINYTSKDFNSLKKDLIEYTKSYFPDTYRDFNETSTGMMLIELSSYVGDVLSYYIDYNYKESIITTASERKNVVRLAEFLGYKTPPVSAAHVKLTVTTDVGVTADGRPNYADAPLSPIDAGLQIQSNVDTGIKFETLEKIDFQLSGSLGAPIASQPSRFDSNGEVTGYTLTAFVNAISAETKTKTFNVTSPVKFLELELDERNVVEILDCRDSSGQKWYEVNYLAQDRILKETHYTINPDRATAYDEGPLSTDTGGFQHDNSSVDVPYTLDYIKTNKKFVTKVNSETNKTRLQFGNGLYKFNVSGSSDTSLFSVIEQQGINVSGVPGSVINASINNLTTNNSLNLGETPANTVMTITYRVGGGLRSNVQVGELTQIMNPPAGVNISVTNEEPASGGTNGQTVTEIKENAKTFFAAQLRCVTREDYQARIFNMPAKFGNIAKCYVHRLNDISGLKIYTLSYDKSKRLTQTPMIVLDNLRIYLEQFRMINDALDFGFRATNDFIFSGYKINFGVNFEINADRRFNPTEVKVRSLNIIKNFFTIDKMNFKQSINLNDLKYEILGLDGVIGVKTLRLFQNTTELAGENNITPRQLSYFNGDGTIDNINGTPGYGFKYDFNAATVDDIVRPSATAAVFELRNPDTDIYGRVI